MADKDEALELIVIKLSALEGAKHYVLRVGSSFVAQTSGSEDSVLLNRYLRELEVHSERLRQIGSQIHAGVYHHFPTDTESKHLRSGIEYLTDKVQKEANLEREGGLEKSLENVVQPARSLLAMWPFD